MASKRTRTIAAIYPSLDNPIFAVSIQSLQQTLWNLGYQLLVGSHDYRPERELGLLRSFVERASTPTSEVAGNGPSAVPPSMESRI